MDTLTVNDEKTLQTKVEELASKSKDNEYMVNTKLADKEKEIQLLRQRDSMNTDAIANLSDKMQELVVKIQELEKRQQQADNIS